MPNDASPPTTVRNETSETGSGGSPGAPHTCWYGLANTAAATSENLGKTAGKDELSDKSTYVRLLGVDGARAEADRLATAAVEHLRAAGVAEGALGGLARYIVERDR